MAAVSADGSTVWVLILRLNSSCSRSIAFVTGMRIPVPAHRAGTALVLAYGVTIRDEGHREHVSGRHARKARRRIGKIRKSRFGKVIVVNEKGPRCSRCGMPTEVREHAVLRERQLRAPFYYARWYRCTTPTCNTTLIMPEEFKVRNYAVGR